MSKGSDVRLFMALYGAELSKHTSARLAYNYTEFVWAVEYGSNFYKNYESFKAAKSRFARYGKNSFKKVRA